MSITASTFRNSLAGFAEACERLVHPSVAEPEERARQGRLFGTLLAGPLLAGVAVVQILGTRLGVAPTIAVICALFGLSWLVALTGMLSGNGRRTELAALGLGTYVVAGLTAVAGGAVSPLAVLAAALPVEAALVTRSSNAVKMGAAAAVIAALAGVTLSVDAGSGGAAAWHWLVPLVYAATVWARVCEAGRIFANGAAEDGARKNMLEENIGAVVLRMTMSGDVADVSPQAATLLGLPPDMLLGSGFFDRIQTTDRVAYLNALADLREGADARTVDLRFRVAATTGVAARYAHVSAELMPDGNGDGLVAVVRDNSEMVELRKALAEAREKAACADLAKSRFLAAVSHELRTPLNAIVGFSDVLGNEMFGRFTDPRQREYAELIRDATGHLLAIVNSILDMSKIESGTYDVQPEAFRFDEAVRLSLSLTAQQAQAKAVSVEAEACEGVGEIHCDRRIVQQVLINLLSNAVKFTPPGGTVTLSARRIHNRVEFDVSDTGIGISAEDLARLGTPFTQVQNDYTRKFEGTGLGLAVVKGLIKLQGGGMTIESAPGAGTCVRIVLPIAQPEQSDTLQRDENDTAQATNQCELNHEPLRKTA